jgi:hypothetical protein
MSRRSRFAETMVASGVTPAKFLEARFPNASVQTTERYLGCKQNLGHPVNDRISLGIVAAG